MTASDMDRALGAFPEFGRLAEPLASAWAKDVRRIDLPGLPFRGVNGGAPPTLTGTERVADARLLDGFAPVGAGALGAGASSERSPRAPTRAALAPYIPRPGLFGALAAADFTGERIPGSRVKLHMTRGTSSA